MSIASRVTVGRQSWLRSVTGIAAALLLGGSAIATAAPASADAAGWKFAMYNISRPADGLNFLAGSTGNMLAFGFVSGGPGSTRIQAQIPGVANGTPWTAPQSTQPGQPGFIRIGQGSCTSAALTSIENPAPGVWFLNAVVDCPTNSQFGIFYGSASGGTKVTAPSRAAGQPFLATVQPPGAVAPSIIAVAPVNVVAGKATAIKIQTRPAVTLVGNQSPPLQPVIIQAVDNLGNRDFTWNGSVAMTYSANRFVSPAGLPASFTLTRGLAQTAMRFPINEQFPYGPANTRMSAKSSDGTLTGAALVRIIRQRPQPSVAASIQPDGTITNGITVIAPNTPLTVNSTTINIDGTQSITVTPVSNPTSGSLTITTGTLVVSNGSNSVVSPTVNAGAQIQVTGCVVAGTKCPTTTSTAPVVIVNPNAVSTGPAISPIAVIVGIRPEVVNPTLTQ